METDHAVTLPCSRCGERFPLDGFYAAKLNVNRHGRHSWCKPCVRADLRRRRSEWTPEQREREAARSRATARSKRLAKYGLTADDYDRLVAAQAGVCAICERPERLVQPNRRDGDESLAVDHDHDTGRVRGLLCMTCNTAIGKLGDDPALLRRAADYLERAGLATGLLLVDPISGACGAVLEQGESTKSGAIGRHPPPSTP